MVQARRGASPIDRAGETRNLLHRFVQHWVLASVVGFVAAFLGYLYARGYQPLYHAEAQVRIGDRLDSRAVPGQKEDPTEFVDLPDALASGFRARFLVDTKLRRLVDNLHTDARLSHLAWLRTEKGREELIEQIKKQALVEPVTRRVFRVIYEGRDPDLVHILAQSLAELGVADLQEERGKTAEQARAFLAQEAETARKKMVAVELEVVRFLRDHPKLIVSATGTERSKLGLGVADKMLLSKAPNPAAALPPVKALELSTSPQVRALLAEKAEVEARVAQIEAAQKFDPVQSKIVEIDRLQQQLLDLKAQNYTGEYPEYQRIEREIARLQQEIRDSKTRRDKNLTGDLRTLADARAQLAALDRQIAMARRRAVGADRPALPDEKLISAEAEYARLTRDMESARAAYEKLRERELDAQINEQLSKVKGNLAARIEDPAKRPLYPRGVSRKMMTLLCMLLGLGLGLCAGVARAVTDPLIYTVYDLAKASRLPVLGRVPGKDGPGSSVLTEVAGDANDSSHSGRMVLPGVPRSERPTGEIKDGDGSGQPAESSAAAPNGNHSSQESDRGGDYMVVYSAPREGRVGTRSGALNLVTGEVDVPLRTSERFTDVAVWEGKGQAPAPRPKTALMASPQSVAFRLTGMGHVLHKGLLKEHPHLFLRSFPDGARAEQYRLLRCRLQDLSDPRVIVLASALRGEGKTVAAANLALAYAEGGAHSVVMVDGHLSSPRLTELCGAQPRSEALSDTDLVAGGLDLWQLDANLFLVPALGPRVKRSAVLSSPAFAMLIADLRQIFDYIIIDTPAVASAADAKIVLRNADAGLFLTRARATPAQAVRIALDRLGRGIMAGVVLNEFSR